MNNGMPTAFVVGKIRRGKGPKGKKQVRERKTVVVPVRSPKEWR